MNILELNAQEVREYFLRASSYCSVDLPPYFEFQSILTDVHEILDGHKLSEFAGKASEQENVNYTIYSNKDGKYAWRPFQLIHPALYVSLVHTITHATAWEQIIQCFQGFHSNDRIRCLSIPLAPEAETTDKAVQIGNWWQEVEQASIALSLDYAYLLETDIADCYASIYTHTIPWALHTKAVAKQDRKNKDLLGKKIDDLLSSMHHGQTNGIPQGSSLMDFLAEMVLGYADQELSKIITCTDYQILRYRDDYRIFVNNPQDGEIIIKVLTETLMDLGLKLNSGKTHSSAEVIKSAIKPDKLAWQSKANAKGNLQQQLLQIHQHANLFPNTGSVTKALGVFQKRLNVKTKPVLDADVLIAIVADISLHNPRCNAVCAAIISKLIQHIESPTDQLQMLARILGKFDRVPNTGHMQVWLQRISLPIANDVPYSESLCRLALGEPIPIWNSSWIRNAELITALDSQRILNRERMGSLPPVIDSEEFQIFSY